MSIYGQALAYRNARLGAAVKKSVTPTAAQTYNLFTISGGRVVITSLMGVVTTTIGSTTTNLSIVYLPTLVGGTETMANATAITSHTAGRAYYINGSVGSPTTIFTGGTGGEANAEFALSYMAPAGNIGATFSAIPGGGVIEFTVTWMPYDDTGLLVAA